jgi:hypothetical protein
MRGRACPHRRAPCGPGPPVRHASPRAAPVEVHSIACLYRCTAIGPPRCTVKRYMAVCCFILTFFFSAMSLIRGFFRSEQGTLEMRGRCWYLPECLRCLSQVDIVLLPLGERLLNVSEPAHTTLFSQIFHACRLCCRSSRTQPDRPDYAGRCPHRHFAGGAYRYYLARDLLALYRAAGRCDL